MKKVVLYSIGCFIGIVAGEIVGANLASMTIEDLHDRSCQIVCEKTEPTSHHQSAYLAAFGAGAFTCWGLFVLSTMVAGIWMPKKHREDLTYLEVLPSAQQEKEAHRGDTGQAGEANL